MNPQVEEPSTVNRRCHCEDWIVQEKIVMY